MHSKFDKMRFEMLNNNVNGEQQEFEEKTTADLKSEESEVNLNLASDLSDVLTLEGLRRTFNSCSNCGVSWYDKHISLDCAECGGYAMVRPCPTCDGQCGSVWRRDVKASRNNKRAQWNGSCSLNCQRQSQNLLESQRMIEDSNANFQTGYHSIPSQSLVNGNQICM